MDDTNRLEKEIRTAIEGEAFGGSRLLNDQRVPLGDPPIIASLLLAIARPRHVRSAAWEWAKPVGVALELLNLAVARHYRVGSERPADLALITGDYYYARAISVIAGLKDGEIVKALAGAIADVAVAEAWFATVEAAGGDPAGGDPAGGDPAGPVAVLMAGKRASLFTTAVTLGARIGADGERPLDGPTLDSLLEYGRLLGLLNEVKRGMIPDCVVRELPHEGSLREKAVEIAAGMAGRPDLRSKLFRLADVRVSSRAMS